VSVTIRTVVGIAVLVVVAAGASIAVLVSQQGDGREHRAVTSAAAARSAEGVVDVWSAALATSTTVATPNGATPSTAVPPATSVTAATAATTTTAATPPTTTSPATTARPEAPAPPTTDAATCQEVLTDVMSKDRLPTAGEAQWLWAHCRTHV
jgi:hypothetical protein